MNVPVSEGKFGLPGRLARGIAVLAIRLVIVIVLAIAALLSARLINWLLRQLHWLPLPASSARAE